MSTDGELAALVVDLLGDGFAGLHGEGGPAEGLEEGPLVSRSKQYPAARLEGGGGGDCALMDGYTHTHIIYTCTPRPWFSAKILTSVKNDFIRTCISRGAE